MMRFPLLNAYHGLMVIIGSLLFFGGLAALAAVAVDYTSGAGNRTFEMIGGWGGLAAVGGGLLVLIAAEVISLILHIENNTHNSFAALDDVTEELKQANSNLRRTATAVEALASTIKRSS